MSLDQFLNQTCIIVRPNPNGVDRYNQTKYADQEVGRDIRCRLVEKDIRIMDEKSSQYAWVQVTMLLLPAGTDVQVKDEVTVESMQYQVLKPLERKRGNSNHHVSVIVEALNG